MGDRSGVGLVELAVLETLEALTAGRPRAYATSAEVVSEIEARIGLRPRYGYEVLIDLIRPWITPIRLVAGWGNFGDRDSDPAEPKDTRCRPSHVGQLVLDAEAHRLAPVPVGLINGTVYGGGTQPPLDPFRVLAALRRLLEGRRVTDAEVHRIVGPPDPVTGCELTGNLDALAKGRPAAIRQTARIIITGVPVPEPDAAVPPGRRGWTGSEISSHPPRPAHLIIESLPARTSPLDADKAITRQAESRGWYGSGPDRVERPPLPVADINDQSRRNKIRIELVLKPGSDPAGVRDRLASVDGITTEATWSFTAPLGRMLRAWIDQHRDEDIAASLDFLGEAVRRDRRREQR